MADARAATAAKLFGTLDPAERALLAELLGRVGAEQFADEADQSIADRSALSARHLEPTRRRSPAPTAWRARADRNG